MFPGFGFCQYLLIHCSRKESSCEIKTKNKQTFPIISCQSCKKGTKVCHIICQKLEIQMSPLLRGCVNIQVVDNLNLNEKKLKYVFKKYPWEISENVSIWIRVSE